MPSHQPHLRRLFTLCASLFALSVVVLPATLGAQETDTLQQHALQQHAQPQHAQQFEHQRQQRAPSRWEYGAWIGTAFDKRSASNNYRIAGEFRMVALWASRAVYSTPRLTLSLLAEAVPVITVTSSTPLEEALEVFRSGATIDATLLSSMAERRSRGIALSPFGGAATYALGHGVKLHADVTAGGALFSNIVPYGKATRANFTVAPSLAVRWEPSRLVRLSTGYKLHHLSNASFGTHNPGMNSHIWFVSLGAVR